LVDVNKLTYVGKSIGYLFNRTKLFAAAISKDFCLACKVNEGSSNELMVCV
jgi:hypothetical protein